MVRITTETDFIPDSFTSLVNQQLLKEQYESTFKKSMYTLIENSNIKLDQNELLKYPKIYNAFKTVDQYFQKDPTRFSSTISTYFRPTVIHVGTIGSFLFGCFQEYYGDNDKRCSPLCIGSLYSSDNSHCEYQVWIQDENGYRAVTNNRNTHAYIYTNIEPLEFVVEDITKFKNAGIEYVQIFYTRGSNHQLRTKIRSLSSLPIKSVAPTLIPVKSLISNPINNSINYAIIIIVLVIIGLCFWFAQN